MSSALNFREWALISGGYMIAHIQYGLWPWWAPAAWMATVILVLFLHGTVGSK